MDHQACLAPLASINVMHRQWLTRPFVTVHVKLFSHISKKLIDHSCKLCTSDANSVKFKICTENKFKSSKDPMSNRWEVRIKNLKLKKTYSTKNANSFKMKYRKLKIIMKSKDRLKLKQLSTNLSNWKI